MAEEQHHNESVFDQIDSHRLSHAFKKSLWFILPLFVTFLAIAYLYIRWNKPVYRASSTIQFEVKKDAAILGIEVNTLQNQNNGGRSSSNVNQLLGEIEIIKSDFIFEELIDKLDLTVSYFEQGNVLVDEHFGVEPFKVSFNKVNNFIPYDRNIYVTFLDTCRFELSFDPDNTNEYKCNQLIELDGFIFRIKRTAFFTEDRIGKSYFFTINSDAALKEYIKQGLDANINNSAANTLDISFSDHDNAKAAKIVNTLVSVYQEQSIKKKNQIQEQTIAFIDQQLQSASDNLRLAEKDIESFVLQTGIISPEMELAQVKMKMDEYNLAKKELLEQSQLLDHIYAFVTTENTETSSLPIVTELDPTLTTSMVELNELYRQFEVLKTSAKPNTAAYQNMIIRIQSLRESILETVFQSQKLVQQKILELNDQILSLDRSFKELPSKETEVTRLKRYFDLWEKFYLLLINKKVEYGIAMAGTVSEFTVLKPAFVPHIAVSPNKFIAYLAAVCLTFVFSFFIILVVYIATDTVMGKSDLQRLTFAPVIAEVPLFTKFKMEHSKLVLNDNPKSSISEAFRNLRTNLKYLSKDIHKSKQIISITSSVSGEGKTFVSVNLAGILAMSGKKVVIIDLDLRKPKIHLGFDAQNTNGMSHILIGQSKWKDCIQKTSIESLDFIAAGDTPPNPSELILRPEFDQLIKDLQNHYDIVIVDTPPAGLVTDARLVMEKADIELYIVKARYSKTSIIKDMDLLQKKQASQNLGIILNAVDMKGSKYGYGYGYYQE